MADNDGGQVDDEGIPETPARQAIEKHKQKQMAVAGVAIGAAGLIFLLFKRGSSGGAPAATPTYTYPTVSPGGGAGLSQNPAPGPDFSGLASLLAEVQSQSATPAEQAAASSSPKSPPIVDVPGIGPSYVLGPTGNPNDYQVYGGTPLWYGVAAQNGVGQGQSAYNSTLGWGYAYAPVNSVSPQQIYGGPSKIPAPGPV